MAGGRPQSAGQDLVAFFAERAPPVETVAHRLDVSLEEAEDIRQEVFEVMWRSSEPIVAPVGFFWKVATRRKARLVDQKARARRYAPALRAEEQRRLSPFPSPEEGVAHAERERAVEEVLSHVKPSRRGVAEMRLRGCDEGEVMAELKLPAGTVRSRWMRARQDGRPYWVALAGLLSAIWLWISNRARSAAHALAKGPLAKGPLAKDPLAKGPTAKGALANDPLANDPLAQAAGAGHAPLAAVAAAMVAAGVGLSLGATAYGAWVAPGKRFAEGLAAMDAGLCEEARRDGDARREAEHRAFAPRLATNAERERESGTRALGGPGKSPAPVLGPPPQGRADHAMARSLLIRASSAYGDGHVGVAEGALRQYRRMFPDNPYPALYGRAVRAGQRR